jgi:hypothetical protein
MLSSIVCERKEPFNLIFATVNCEISLSETGTVLSCDKFSLGREHFAEGHGHPVTHGHAACEYP